ncbi:MAG: hypothetical protein GAK29_01806 [Acinetobacter bereziniae]|uniref:Uncharacterized protein n=1 Tax=Acinetobacter bereziniae TaxID=106648 RepID=A0A833PFK7_ACIBZ|nr:MAG: hypothetical protein GAK29_01806 [Acinetobacter bereziniae]
MNSLRLNVYQEPDAPPPPELLPLLDDELELEEDELLFDELEEELE